MLEPNVVEGVHRIEDAYTNWYLIEDDGRLTIVDTGMPTSWNSLLSALQSLGRTHCAFASADVRHTRSFAQLPIRLSIVRQ